MSIEYQHSILWRGEDPLKRKFQPKLDTSTKTARYFPGKAPKWAADQVESKDRNEVHGGSSGSRPPRDGNDLKRQRRHLSSAGNKEDAAASRLQRLRAAAAGEGGVQPSADRLQRRRQFHEARVIEEHKEDEDGKEEEKLEKEEELGAKLEDGGDEGRAPVGELRYDEVSGSEEDDVKLRALCRERAREVALERRKVEEEEIKKEIADDEEEAEDEDEMESEEDSGTDEDDPRRGAMLKPIFVSKAQRETIREKAVAKKEEEEAEVRKQEVLKQRKAESKTLVIEEIRLAEEAEREGLGENDRSDIELIDDDDEKNEAEEYELWKIRELKRIKRDKEERLERQKEVEWIMKRRNMTEEERIEDDKRLDAKAAKRDEVKNFGFLQKYYHRGGYFQDKAVNGEEPLYLRDYHEPLEEEKFDKNLLPQAMQLRRGQFGKKGQVKHTHLTEVDTTDMSAAWSQSSKQVQKYQERMAAAKGVNDFERPSAVAAAGSSRSRA